MLTLLHASDLHFGKHFDPEAARILLDTLPDLSPDLIVLSGDFTQRAKVREYRMAREFLRSLDPIPVVVTPGNHDVPLYRVWERLLSPHGNYRKFISPELDTVTTVPGATVVALNSTAPWRAIVNGRIRDGQLLFAAGAFEETSEGDARIVVLHHHLASAPDYEADQVLPGFQRCLAAFGRMKVDLVLGGHLHRSYVANSLDTLPGEGDVRPIVIAHAGTATSRRGRARERNKNSFNLIALSEEVIRITQYQVVLPQGVSAPVGIHLFPRREVGILRRDSVRDVLGLESDLVSKEVNAP